jgi:CHAT domain-containing protein
MVMTLWSVDDEATKDFMVKFYEELAANQWDKRTAFEKTKEFIREKTYIRNGKSYKGDPYYWAGFVMLD